MPLPPAPIAVDRPLSLLVQLCVLLLLALILGRLASRLGMPAVAGELCVGSSSVPRCRPTALLMAGVALAIAVVGKFAGTLLGARSRGLNIWESLALGAGLNPRGVIQIVVASVGLRLGVLNTVTHTVVILVAIATSLMAAPILRFATRRLDYPEEEELRLRERAALTNSHSL